MTEVTQADRDLFIVLTQQDDYTADSINAGLQFTGEVEMIALYRENAELRAKAYWYRQGKDDGFDQARERIEVLEAENARFREALVKVAKPDYGYMDILESGQPPEKHADYFCSMVSWRRITARAALECKDTK